MPFAPLGLWPARTSALRKEVPLPKLPPKCVLESESAKAPRGGRHAAARAERVIAREVLCGTVLEHHDEGGYSIPTDVGVWAFKHVSDLRGGCA